MYKFGDYSAILCYDLNGALQPLWVLGRLGSQSVFPMLSWTFPGTSLSGEFAITASSETAYKNASAPTFDAQ